MARKFLAAFAATTALAFASQADATVFVLDSIDVTAHTADTSGLQVGIINHISSPLIFDLGAEDPQTFALFTIYTPESTVNAGEDTVPQDISVDFNFSAPLPNSVDPITGETTGEIENEVKFFGHVIFNTQHGELTWNNGGVTNMYFGQNLTGLMSISVNGGQFNNGVLGLNDGIFCLPPSAFGLTVYGTFDWDRDPITTAVPEPATWALMIGGFGMAGAAVRRRRAIAA